MLKKLKRKLAKKENTIEKEGPHSLFENAFVIVWRMYRSAKRILLGAKHPIIAHGVLALKDAERRLVSGSFTFVTFQELTAWTLEWTERLPRFDLVVGIPRSGLLVASLIALRQAVPLSTPDMVTRVWASKHISPREPKRILLVDDSISTGVSLDEARTLLVGAYPKARIETAALIVSKNSRSRVDYAGIVIESPRLFEWNFLHSKKGRVAFDLDGVIGEEPEPGLRENDEHYRLWIRNARPRFIPSYTVDLIVSNRPEIVRAETEEWLHTQGVRYGELILDRSMSERTKHAHKVSALISLKPDLFIESSASEAIAIAKETRVPVLCVGDWRIYQ